MSNLIEHLLDFKVNFENLKNELTKKAYEHKISVSLTESFRDLQNLFLTIENYEADKKKLEEDILFLLTKNENNNKN